MELKENTGYLYVLFHPDLPHYYKLGQTTKHPMERLKSHNTDRTKILGKLVQLTNKPWQLIYYVPVTNPRKAESATLWYDVLPRWDNLELNNGDVIVVIEDIIKSPYLDQDKYNFLLGTELVFYDYKSLIESFERGWERDGLVDQCDELIKKVKDERLKNDKRHRYKDD
ncbi:hypothetical protein K7J14_02465 [Treponema zuelzerae]|uniref:GIY-YIG domain-containing protein n=1 Tax=Teretinema zuelzerae TaxID=156 RepID=A0AAE3JHZ3_9SPIR|nr:GIY-YIG nuclease family protein [Teretinema zuelzerae]MCD1653561.1 hypothetical protein [Teretinema zuelzerae]